MIVQHLLSPLFLLAMLSTACAGIGCSLPYENILAAGGFSGLMDCPDSGQASAKVVGEIVTFGHKYAILDYRYETKPTAEGVAHGGQRILIIQDDRRFLGQYALSSPPVHTVSIRGTSIVIDVPANHGNAITFDNDGPPARAYLGQESVQLFK